MANKTKDKDIQKGEQSKVGVKDSDLTQLSRNDLMTELYRRGRTPEDVMTGRNLTGPEIEAVATLNELNKGGMPKQMEMFDNGGLKDEGGMIDEVSGNDVPTGSTREEVRDDIPAQLSEGEFVLPADVVRFHGLEKIMELRDEAKAGLAKMEAMGQMGNSEEATLPDEMPFSLEDLDMEDEDQPQEMAEGGYVMVAGKPMPISMIGGQLPPITTRPMTETKNMAVGGFTNSTGTYQVPTNIATQPSYFQNYQQSTAPFQPFVPSGETQVQPVAGLQQQQTFPSFSTLMPTVGGKRETIEYRNDAGQKLFIPFVDGKPIYPIPEGYTKYTAETEITPEKQPTVQSTTVRQDQQDGGDDNVLSGTSQVRGLDNSIVSTDFANQTPDKVAQNLGNMNSIDRANAVQSALQTSYGYTGLSKGMQQLGAAVVPGVLAGKMYGQKTLNPMDILGQIGQPDMAARDAITGAFGYNPASYDMDDPMDANLAGIDQQNAINTAMFGGKVTGTEDKSRGGIAGITIGDIQREYGIAPSYTSRGNKDVQIEIGTNPGQMMNGVFYDAGGRGNSLDAAYSGPTAALGYMSMAHSLGYYGSPGMAREQAKQGNKKAQAVVRGMNTMDAEKGADRGNPSFTSIDVTDPVNFDDPKSGYGIGTTGGVGSQTIGIETDVTGIGTSTGPGATAGSPSGGGVSTADDSTGVGSTGDADSPGGGPGGAATEGVFKQGGLAKRKPKVKKMKRGGLASR